MPTARRAADAKADAIALGYLDDGGVVVSASTGMEILYVRGKDGKPARLRVSKLAGNFVRPSAGVTTRAVASSYYGDADTIMAATKRMGLELGFVVASIGSFRALDQKGAADATGWSSAIGPFWNFGVPLVSDSGAFSLSQTPVLSIVLTQDETELIEAQLATFTDHKILRKLCQPLFETTTRRSRPLSPHSNAPFDCQPR